MTADALHDWAGGCMGRNPISRLCFLITTAQNLAPNGVTSTRWQRLNLGDFVFNCFTVEEALFMSVERTNPQKRLWGSSQLCVASFSFTVMVQSHCFISHIFISRKVFSTRKVAKWYLECHRRMPRSHAKTSVHDEPCI